jgi:hypothetical protein
MKCECLWTRNSVWIVVKYYSVMHQKWELFSARYTSISATFPSLDIFVQDFWQNHSCRHWHSLCVIHHSKSQTPALSTLHGHPWQGSSSEDLCCEMVVLLSKYIGSRYNWYAAGYWLFLWVVLYKASNVLWPFLWSIVHSHLSYNHSWFIQQRDIVVKQGVG